MKQSYRCVTPTLEGFVQQLSTGFVARGYFFYVTGHIKANQDPHRVDRKIVNKFNVAISKWARYRRKQKRTADGQPLANTQYIRHRNFFVLLCTPGHHLFFEAHETRKNGTKNRQWADVRRKPIVYGGYSIGYRNGHASVRMSHKAYKELKVHFLQLAVNGRREELEREFTHAPFEPWGGVIRQMYCILQASNRVRKSAGLPPISRDCLRTRRRQLRPFAEPDFQNQLRNEGEKNENANPAENLTPLPEKDQSPEYLAYAGRRSGSSHQATRDTEAPESRALRYD